MSASSRPRPRRIAGETYDAFAGAGLADVPVVPDHESRARTRRGGPRTPFPLLPVIGVLAGVGIAYVAQTAHLTQTTYQATTLAAEQSALQQENAQLGDQLARLGSAARIDAAAQMLGMRPPVRWSYVSAVAAPVTVPGAPPALADAPTQGDAVQRFVAALTGSFGPQEAEAAAP